MILQIAIFIVLFIYVKYIFILWCQQDEIIFGDKKNRGYHLDDTAVISMNKQEFGMNCKQINFKGKSGMTMNGFHLTKDSNKNNDKSFTLVFFHDSIFNYFYIMEFISVTIDRVGCDAIFFPFHGYAGTHGKPSIASMITEGEDILDFTLNKYTEINSNKIILFGKGLGASIAIHASKKYTQLLKAIILENPFTSLIDLMKYEFKYAFCLVNLLFKSKLNNLHIIKGIETPLLFLIAREDQTVPYTHSLELLEEAKYSKFKDYKIINFADHHDIYKLAYKSYYNKMKEFSISCLSDNISNNHVLDLEDNILTVEN